jgi:predicted ATP-dependent serine protease
VDLQVGGESMAKYICEGCGAITSNSDKRCQRCRELASLHRTIKAMLMPYVKIKKEKERETKNDNS